MQAMILPPSPRPLPVYVESMSKTRFSRVARKHSFPGGMAVDGA